MIAYILLGGLGTRLRPLTYHTPKPLLPLAGKPFLWYQLNLLARHGVRRVILGTGYKEENFRSVSDSFAVPGLAVEFVVEKEPRGTAGALALARKNLSETAFVLNGDILTDLDLSAMLREHRERRSLVTLALYQVAYPSRYGLVDFDEAGRVSAFREKPAEVPRRAWINAGVYLLEPEAVRLIPDGVNCSLEREVFPALIKSDRPVYAYRHAGYWLDIGTLHAYCQAKGDLKSGRLVP